MSDRLPKLPQAELDKASNEFVQQVAMLGLLPSNSIHTGSAALDSTGSNIETRISGQGRSSRQETVQQTSRPPSRSNLDTLNSLQPQSRRPPSRSRLTTLDAEESNRSTVKSKVRRPLSARPSSANKSRRHSMPQPEMTTLHINNAPPLVAGTEKSRPSSSQVQPPATPNQQGPSRNKIRRHSMPQPGIATLHTNDDPPPVAGTEKSACSGFTDADSEKLTDRGPGPARPSSRGRRPSIRNRKPSNRKESKRVSTAKVASGLHDMSFKSRWQSELEDPQHDVEMKLEKVINVLSECKLLDERLASAVTLSYLKDIAYNGADIPGVTTVSGGYSGALSFAQFVGVLHWIAALKRIGYADCVTMFMNRFATGRGSYRPMLKQFWSNNCRSSGTMNAMDVHRLFDKTMLPPEQRPKIQEIYVMFSQIRKKKSTVDFDEYEHFLELLAEKQSISISTLVFKMLYTEHDNADADADINPLERMDVDISKPAPPLTRALSDPELGLQTEMEKDQKALPASPAHRIKSQKSFKRSGSSAFDAAATSTGYESD